MPHQVFEAVYSVDTKYTILMHSTHQINSNIINPIAVLCTLMKQYSFIASLIIIMNDIAKKSIGMYIVTISHCLLS